MPRAAIRSVVALVPTVLLFTSAVAGAKTVDPSKMTLVRRAVILTITSGTERDPVGLTLKCAPRSQVIVRCSGAWRDARATYAGRFIAVDEEDAWTALFAGLRADRACLKRARSVAERRACREGVSW